MKVLKFNLSGEFAFFKNEIINDIYDTYPHIHKPALLGLFGAILGYDGYAQTQKVFGKKDNSFPEYYKKLRDLKIAIVPKKVSFSKLLETFTNTTLMFNKDSTTKEGTNLIVEQFWLENPSWDIYLMIDNEESEKLLDSIVNSKTIYNLYLGTNNHFANITDIGIFEAKEIKEDMFIINSLVKSDEINSKVKNMLTARKEGKNLYYFNYILPTILKEETNIYEKENFVLTNDVVEMRKNKAYNVNEVNVVFY